MLIKSSDGKDYLSIEYIGSFQGDDFYEYTFEVDANIDLFCFTENSYDSRRIWIYEQDLKEFLQELQEINISLKGKAEMKSKDDDFRLSIESYDQYGYLLVSVLIKYRPYQYQHMPDILENSFRGSFIVEPAKLTEWFSELEKLYREKPGRVRP